MNNNEYSRGTYPVEYSSLLSTLLNPNYFVSGFFLMREWISPFKFSLIFSTILSSGQASLQKRFLNYEKLCYYLSRWISLEFQNSPYSDVTNLSL